MLIVAKVPILGEWASDILDQNLYLALGSIPAVLTLKTGTLLARVMPEVTTPLIVVLTLCGSVFAFKLPTVLQRHFSEQMNQSIWRTPYTKH